MGVDLNKIAEKLKKREPLAVTKNGQLEVSNPKNDGTSQQKKGFTTLKPTRFFNDNPKFIIGAMPIMNMLSECYQNGTAEETGGILIGLKEHNRIISHAIPSGKHAVREASMYHQTKTDIDELQEKLGSHQMQGRDLIGYFHQHPPGITELSLGDKKSCLDLLKSPEMALNGELLMLIITRDPSLRENSLPIYSYLVTLKRKNKVSVKSVNLEVVPDQFIEMVGEYLN